MVYTKTFIHIIAFFQFPFASKLLWAVIFFLSNVSIFIHFDAIDTLCLAYSDRFLRVLKIVISYS